LFGYGAILPQGLENGKGFSLLVYLTDTPRSLSEKTEEYPWEGMSLKAETREWNRVAGRREEEMATRVQARRIQESLSHP